MDSLPHWAPSYRTIAAAAANQRALPHCTSCCCLMAVTVGVAKFTAKSSQPATSCSQATVGTDRQQAHIAASVVQPCYAAAQLPSKHHSGQWCPASHHCRLVLPSHACEPAEPAEAWPQLAAPRACGSGGGRQRRQTHRGAPDPTDRSQFRTMITSRVQPGTRRGLPPPGQQQCCMLMHGEIAHSAIGPPARIRRTHATCNVWQASWEEQGPCSRFTPRSAAPTPPPPLFHCHYGAVPLDGPISAQWPPLMHPATHSRHRRRQAPSLR